MKPRQPFGIQNGANSCGIIRKMGECNTLPMGVFYCLLRNGGMICEKKESFIYIRISY
ncbi:hypothetical protein JBW_02074 [Pelosinus fermentans JBW45]|uniref:Uncharacterized protein n=1 Tax=Pelosinus fermentans JBW45 TaxID=1192197 RepID=I9NXR6_9FIRM|nr:hypothetical protein JBW_02074 [Pelosinus fermentans JBW45]